MRRFPFPDTPEFQVFKKLTSPAKVQDFVNAIPMNFEKNGETCHSPRAVLTHKKAQCLEGALLAAAVLWYHGRPPLLLDLETNHSDESHVVALFTEDGYWGAISKTNHGVLRYRDPVYKTIRELALSYFNEYFLHNGKKTLRTFSKRPFSLLDFEDEWLTADYPVWNVHDELIDAPHEKIAPDRVMRRLRPADSIEIKAGKLTGEKT
ncbi:MAG: hypothetical protein KBD16_02075 [Candidatus Pacebacteria bacterium]|nr:hypothetical protein [Candidatus Paceibacterota bacterium]